VQTFSSIAHWHPHLHVLITDGAFTRGGRFLPAPGHDPLVLEESWRRAVLAWFAREGWLEDEAAVAMLAWPHSGFGAHVGPVIADDDLQSLTRVARAPVACCPPCTGLNQNRW